MSAPAPATSALGAAVRHDSAPAASRAASPDQAIFIGILVIVAVGAAKILLRRRLSRRHATSLDLIMVTVGFLLLLIMRLPMTGSSGYIGLAFFLGLAALYKLLGYFEEPTDKD